MKQIILGTAGHIDHGKTTLIKALTGIDTDRLKEEKWDNIDRLVPLYLYPDHCQIRTRKKMEEGRGK